MGQPMREPSLHARRRRRGQWSLRAAVALWIFLAVAGWGVAVLVAYSFVRHGNETAAIKKIDGLNEIAPSAGTAEPAQP